MQILTGQVYKAEKYYFAHGGLADVWRGIWLTEGEPTKVAVKVVRGTWLEPAYQIRLREVNRSFLLKLLREGEVWSQLKHPFVTPFLGVSFDFDRPNTPCLVLPYYKHGNLSDYLTEHPLVDRLNVATQVAAGLAYLHSLEPRAVIHGDIKASNILINDLHQVSLTDFDLSRILESSGFTTKTVGGTCRWMAHELIVPTEDGTVPQVTTATDVWAFGMTLIEIYCDVLPFRHIKYDPGVILAVLRGERPQREDYPEVNDAIWVLMKCCWSQQPFLRPSMNALSFVLNVICNKSLTTSAEAQQLMGYVGRSPWHSKQTSPALQDLRYTAESYFVGNSSSRQTPGTRSILPPIFLQRFDFPCHWSTCSLGFDHLPACQEHEATHLFG